jgi:hypothetical protein
MKLYHLQEVDETGDHDFKQNKPDSERKISQVFYQSQNLNHIYAYVYIYIYIYAHTYTTQI